MYLIFEIARAILVREGLVNVSYGVSKARNCSWDLDGDEKLCLPIVTPLPLSVLIFPPSLVNLEISASGATTSKLNSLVLFLYQTTTTTAQYMCQLRIKAKREFPVTYLCPYIAPLFSPAPS